MSKDHSGSVSTAEIIGTVASLITIALTFAPGPIQDFMLKHSLVGWLLFAVAILASSKYIAIRTRSIKKNLETDWGGKVETLSSHWHKQEATLTERWNAKIDAISRQDWILDLPLLSDRMTHWELESSTYIYLSENVTHTQLPMQLVKELEDSIASWNRDSREFANPVVISAWEQLEKSANAYERKIDEFMWQKGNKEYLEVPREWNFEDNPRYRKAFVELADCRNSFIRSLGGVHKVQHSLSSKLLRE
ncbi:hypothetical protein [Arthrobacter psychrochitiniphilus]|uniref:Uncharacterized protein n=1 Tax=Arthrobacter psychrochitiniphilus TaxID=291045 RepID=A0A2V3DNI4_9MICC|nr:hypothetical protein [Arthrobacter psychrochitiniphilus]NYG15939.1 hypothetical protein [Arthrobacter psychrochitiniphilus]PXA63976.1 hypothetical protein CVS29_17525 [Arthrobacter psychrochitiniphilus]